MAAWTNRAVFQLPRNGTATHTVDPTSATNLVSGAAFTPTAGRLLVAVIEGGVTSSTPSGWTLPASGSAVNNSGLYVWYRTAASGSNAFTTTHNGSNYPVVVTVYEFPAGSTFVKSVAGTGITYSGANPAVTGLTGTNTVMAVKALAAADSSAYAFTWTGTPTPTEDVDLTTPKSGTDGYAFTIGYVDGFTGTSYQPTATNAITSGSHEALTFAVNVPAGGGSFTGSGSLTLPALTGTGAAATTVPVFNGAGAVAFPSFGATGTASSAGPVFAGSGNLSLPALGVAGSAARTAPDFPGSGTPGLPAFASTGTATTTPPGNTGAGDWTLPAFGLSGDAAAVPPAFTGAGTPVLPGLTASGAAVHASTGEGVGNLTLPPFTFEGNAATAVPDFQADGALALPILGAFGVAAWAPEGGWQPFPATRTLTGQGHAFTLTGDAPNRTLTGNAPTRTLTGGTA